MRFSRINRAIKDAKERLILKVLRLGSDDAQTAFNAANFGVDSSPIKNMVAIHGETGVEGQPVIVGYIKPGALAEPGETHLYSTDGDGNDSFRIKLLTDGTAEIGGNADFAVRFNKLKTAFDELKGKHNNLVDAFNSHVHPTAATGPPSTPTPAPPLIPASPSTADIDPAKIDNIKTP